ncbi:MAG: hypothetical protein JNG89_01480 [Planctomycetaceae bacterium]|nr:hypothetical protein [Planctomycetaceae bacterium]
MRSIRHVGYLGLILTLVGCGSSEPPMQRDTVHKVTGKILIDGKPEPTVAIRLTRLGDADPNAGTSKSISPGGFTDTDGTFAIGTYEGGANGDGAPDGKYALTVQWGQVNLLGGRYEGDKFNGKYADPATSEFIVRVEGGPVQIPTIELNTKDLPEVKLPAIFIEQGNAPQAPTTVEPK